MKILRHSRNFLVMASTLSSFNFIHAAPPDVDSGIKVKDFARGVNAAQDQYRTEQLRALFKNASRHPVQTRIERLDRGILMTLESTQKMWPGAKTSYLLGASKNESGVWIIQRVKEDKDIGGKPLWEPIAFLAPTGDGTFDLKTQLGQADRDVILKLGTDTLGRVKAWRYLSGFGLLTAEARFFYAPASPVVDLYLKKLEKKLEMKGAPRYEGRPFVRDSIKNIVLGADGTNVIQFVADIEPNVYHLDFKAPVSPVQAFSLAVAILKDKYQ